MTLISDFNSTDMWEKVFLQSFVFSKLGKVLGIDSYVLSPKETNDLYPLMNVEDLYGTLYSPGDGTIDPAGWATTLTRAAKNNGAQVWTNSIA